MAENTEKVYTIPLRDAWKGPCKKRSKKCMYVIREFVKRHMKTEKVKVGIELNHEIWNRGIKNPPRKVKVQVIPHEDVVWVEMQGVKLELEKKDDKKKAEEPKNSKETVKADKKAETKTPIKEAKKDATPKAKADVKKETKEKPADDVKKENPEVKAEKKDDPSDKLPPKAALH